MDLPTLTDPGRLLWLLLLPVLYWLSRPLRPRQTVATPHLAQWLRARARLRRKPVRFRWLRFLLLALACVMSVLAFAGARLGGRAGPTQLVVLLDTSASMGARGAAAPWRSALAHLEQTFAQLPAHIEVRLALCGEGVRTVSGSTAELRAAVPAAPSGAGGVDLRRIAQRLQGSAERVATWTITDGLGPTPPPDTGALTVVGAPAANVGITSLSIDDHWPLPDVTVTVTLESFATAPRELRVEVEGSAVDPTEPVVRALPSDATETIELTLVRRDGGRMRVLLRDDRDDALAADDAVEFELPRPIAPDIAVRADEDAGPFIHAAAAVLAEETGGQVVSADAGGEVGLLLVEGGILPQRDPGLRLLSFGTRAGTAPLEPSELIAEPKILDWDRTDPLTRGLDLSELVVRNCLQHDFLGSGKSLVFAEHGSLMTVDDGDTASSVHAAFRLSDSNFGTLAAFPQFLRRCLVRAYRERAEAVVAPGQLLSAAESDLRGASPGASRPADRPLPAFGAPGSSLAVSLLLVALAAMVLRVYV